MKSFNWDNRKNDWLKSHRGVGFEQVILLIEAGDVLDIIEPQNKKKYPNQRIFVVNINNYAYRVPFVENEKEIFLKTIFPDRRSTKRYLKGDETYA